MRFNTLEDGKNPTKPILSDVEEEDWEDPRHQTGDELNLKERILLKTRPGFLRLF